MYSTRGAVSGLSQGQATTYYAPVRTRVGGVTSLALHFKYSGPWWGFVTVVMGSGPWWGFVLLMGSGPGWGFVT